MSAAGLSGCFDRSRLKIAVSVLALALVATLGLMDGEARAERPVQPEAAIKPDHQQLFTALDQWMGRNEAAYHYDLENLRDPFLPAKLATDQPDPRKSVFSQLKLVAITRVNNGSQALASFEDGFGLSYNLRVGDLIGPNNERVVKISGSAVTVEMPGREPGQAPSQTEIKLPAPGLTAGLAQPGEVLQIRGAD